MRRILARSTLLAALVLTASVHGGFDTDGDGVPDGEDCAPLDETIWAAPSNPVSDLTVRRDGTDAILEWSRPGDLGGVVGSERYDVLGTAEPERFGHATGFCVELEGEDLTSTDDRAFDLGPASYYLVRVQNRCGSAPVVTDPPPAVARELRYLRVSNTNDSGPGSLREAIDLASEGDAICLDVTGTLTLTSANLDVLEDIAIAGPGSDKLTIKPAGALPGFGLFELGAHASLSAVRLEGRGWTAPAVRATGTPTIRSTTITNFHDAVNAAGHPTIINSTLSYNSRGVNMCCDSGATLINSTISGGGYGISAYYDSTINIISSTISNTSTALYAYIGIDFAISSSTISGNNRGIVLNYYDSTARLDNTILDNNTDCYAVCCDNFVFSDGHNLSSDTSCSLFTEPGDQQKVDSLLGPLADNGGPTPTRALLPGSPAIDAGSCPTRVRDQRGLPRRRHAPGAPGAARCDIGAFEKQ